MRRLTDEELMEGKAGEMSGIMLVRRDLMSGGLDLSGLTDDQRRHWFMDNAEMYADLGYTPTPIGEEPAPKIETPSDLWEE